MPQQVADDIQCAVRIDDREGGLRFACRQADNQVGVIGLDLGFVSGFVARDLAATVTAVYEYITAFGVGNGADGAQNAAAGILTVAGVDVHVKRAKAEGAMVARGVAERKHLFAAVLADKAAIVFLKSFLFHCYFPTQNFENISATISSLTAFPSTSPRAPMARSTSLAAQSALSPIS